MRHAREMSNAEQWNPKVNKGSLENCEMENTIMRHDYDQMSVEGPSPAPAVSKQLNSAVQDHSAGQSHRETSTLDDIEKIQPSSRQAAGKTDPLLKNDEIRFEKPTPSSFDTFRKKRRNRRSKIWIFLPLGLLISIVSGVVMAYWMSPAENIPDITSQANYIEESGSAYEDKVDMVLSGGDEDYIPDDGDLAMGSEDDILEAEVYAEMNDDKEILDDTEYAEDDLAGFAGEDSSFDEEFLLEPMLREKKDTHKETGTITINKESVADDKIAAAISVLKENVNSKDKVINKEVIEKTVAPEPAIKAEQAEVKIAAVVNSEQKQAETVKPVSQQAAMVKNGAGIKNELVDNRTRSISTGLHNADKIPVDSEVGGKTFDNAEPVEISDKEAFRTAPVQVKESVSKPVITASIMSDLIDTETDENTKTGPQSPLHRSVGLSPRSNLRIPSRADKVMAERNDPVKIVRQESISAEPKLTKKDAEKNDDISIVTASVQGTPAITADIKALQTGISSSLKEMMVNYEDRFNSHNNEWPEYEDNKASAAIANGEYHIENRAGLGTHALIHPVGVPMNMDFMIDISIGSVSSSGEHAYGFVFGAKDTRNAYAFLVRNGHLYSIEKMSNGSSAEIAGGKIENTFIREDSQKSLKIVKRQNKVRFYIDGHFVDEMTDIDYFGDKTGFLVRGKVKMSVDRMHTQIRYQK